MRKLRWFLVALLLCGGLLFLLWPTIARWIDRKHGVVPIVLYGRVVDENGDPLEAVVMTAEVRKLAWFTNPIAPRFSTMTLTAVSDGQGEFSFHSEGIALRITGINKEGWRDLAAPKSFHYPASKHDYPPGLKPRPDDPDNPVEYPMRREQDG